MQVVSGTYMGLGQGILGCRRFQLFDLLDHRFRAGDNCTGLCPLAFRNNCTGLGSGKRDLASPEAVFDMGDV
jgi:hypothetical protein